MVLGSITEPPPQGPAYRRIGARLAGIASRVVVGGGHDLARSAELARQDLGPGDVILLKGRTSQRLERVALRLQGQPVGCDIVTCQAPRWITCERCPVRVRGWQGRRVLP